MLLHDFTSLKNYVLNHKCIFHSVLIDNKSYTFWLFTKAFIWLNHYKYVSTQK